MGEFPLLNFRLIFFIGLCLYRAPKNVKTKFKALLSYKVVFYHFLSYFFGFFGL